MYPTKRVQANCLVRGLLYLVRQLLGATSSESPWETLTTNMSTESLGECLMFAERKPNGKWLARYRDEHGKRRSAGTFDTQAEALAAAHGGAAAGV